MTDVVVEEAAVMLVKLGAILSTAVAVHVVLVHTRLIESVLARTATAGRWPLPPSCSAWKCVFALALNGAGGGGDDTAAGPGVGAAVT